MRTIGLNFIATDAAYICASQTPGAAGALLINGTGKDQTSAAGRVLLPGGFTRPLTLTSTGNLSGQNFTITGTNVLGAAISEVIAGPNNNTVTTTNSFLTVTGISVSAATAAALTVGIASTGTSIWIRHDTFKDPFSLDLACAITGTINYSAVVTNDTVTTGTTITTFPFATVLTAAVANQTANLGTPKRYSQLLVNSSSGGTLDAKFIQAG